MTTKDDAQKSLATKNQKSSAPRKQKTGDAQEANGGLTRKQVLALWELVIMGDGKTATQRRIELEKAEVKGLESARLITIESGPRKSDPAYGSKVHLTEEGWAWANRQGFAARLSPTTAAIPVFEALLGKIGEYLKTHHLALDHLLRPRRAEPAPAGALSTALEERIRAAYLRVTGGALNEYVNLARLRAELPGEPASEVDAMLLEMQQKGGTVLYPTNNPQALGPEDEAAALHVAGVRRDVVCIER